MGVSDALCAFIAGQRFGTLPASTVGAAKRVLLDATGVILGASGQAPEVQPFVKLAASMGAGPCAILGTGLRVTAPFAALANGAMAHAIDYEDAFDLVPGHPNASLVPVLLALAQSEGAVDGRRFLTALAVGCEVSCRMALALRQEMELGGWYPPPMLAGFGAVAGAANLLGLTATEARDAFSLMLCQTVMPGEIKYSPATVIRAVREGFPAQAAVTSALLAREGIAGFEQPLEGKAGFYSLYAGGQFDPAELTGGLGQSFWIEALTFKPWPSCRGTHSFIELALDLRAANGLNAHAVAAIELRIDEVQQMLVEPLLRKAAPQVAIDAKFSIPFCVASALRDGRVDLDSFDSEALNDPELQALATKVSAKLDPAPHWLRGSGGGMVLRMHTGREFAGEVANARGNPDRSLSEADLLAKFIDCAGRAQIPVNAEAIARQIANLETCADVGAVFC